MLHKILSLPVSGHSIQKVSTLVTHPLSKLSLVSPALLDQIYPAKLDANTEGLGGGK